MGNGYKKQLKEFLIAAGKFNNASPNRMLICPSMITYPNYKFYFPIKAFGMYKKRWGDEALR